MVTTLCRSKTDIAPQAVELAVTSVVSSMLSDTIVARDTPLMDAGIDSLAAAELVQQLNIQFSSELPATTLFDYPSIASIASHLGSQIQSQRICSAVKSCEASIDITPQVAEDVIASIVSSMLGDTNVARDTPFIDAGIDSLTATELAQQLGIQLSSELPATTLFDYPSVVSIAQHLGSQF